MSQSVKAEAKSLRELLSGVKYHIDYYQREYVWGEKQVQDLIDDLTQRFLEEFDTSHSREQVAKYRGYFLGSIIVSRQDEKLFLIDGQQRLTSLTLLLIYLDNLQKQMRAQAEEYDSVLIEDMIFSKKFGRASYNLDIEEREEAMEALRSGSAPLYPPSDNLSQSVQNIYARYKDIEARFPEELKDPKYLPYFIDWLTEKVYMLRILVDDEDEAYVIFETMNDRGLSLSPTDMLKSYLLGKIEGEKQREDANKKWQQISNNLSHQMTDFLKAWLRGRYAKTLRDRSKNAPPEDFEKIGSQFHRWLRDNAEERIGIKTADDYYRFVREQMPFYADWYYKLASDPTRTYGAAQREELIYVYYLRCLGFTLLYPLLMAVINYRDSDVDIKRKWRIVSFYLEALLMRRKWNRKSTSYNAMEYSIFSMVREIRNMDALSLAEYLKKRLQDEQPFGYDLVLNRQNKYFIRYILARITDFVEIASQTKEVTRRTREGKDFEYYMNYVPDKNLHYDIEHIIPTAEAAKYGAYRDKIGALLLVKRSSNRSLNDIPFHKKKEHYLKENLLAASLNPLAYANNPGFIAFQERYQLPFRSYENFTKGEIEERHQLYIRLAELIWNPDHLLELAQE